MANWYVSSVAHAAVTQFAVSHAYSVGDIVRQLAAPTTGNERCFRCTTAGTSAGAEAAWTLTKASTTAQGTATFTEITGDEAYQNTTTWAAPFARLRSLCASGSGWLSAGSVVYVANNHAETEAAGITISMNSPNITTPTKVLCVANPTSAIPPAAADLTTGASCTVTGASTITFSMNTTGTAYFYGIAFNNGSGANNCNLNIADGNGQNWRFEQCQFNILATGSTSVLKIGNGGTTSTNNAVSMINCNVTLSAAGQSISPFFPFRWYGGTLNGTSPTNLFCGATNSGVNTGDIRDVDLSLVGASCYLTNGANMNTTACALSFTNCKLSASLAGVQTGTLTGIDDAKVDVSCSGASGTVVREEHYRYQGSYIYDTTNYRTNGASDGTTKKSWKFVSSANCNVVNQLEGSDIYQWVSTGSKTFTMYIANISSLTLKDSEVGFDIEYLGTSAQTLGTITSSMTNVIGAGTNLSTTSEGWTGLASPTKQIVTKTVTINVAGWVRIRPVVRRASLTVWIDPLIAVS